MLGSNERGLNKVSYVTVSYKGWLSRPRKLLFALVPSDRAAGLALEQTHHVASRELQIESRGLALDPENDAGVIGPNQGYSSLGERCR